MARRKFSIETLGDSCLIKERGGACVHADLSGRPRRLWMLIVYLAVNPAGATVSELVDILWPDGAAANATSTLQNNASRARALLESSGFANSKELIVNRDGRYWWAPDADTKVDADEFEARVRKAEGRLGDEKVLNDALKTLDMYKRDFLSDAGGELWCVNRSVYYRSLFVSLACQVLGQLEELGRVADAERLALRANELDPVMEEFNVFLMRAYIAGGKPQTALTHYEHAKALYRDVYGVDLPASIEKEHNIALQELYGSEIGQDEIRSFLDEGTDDEGAFYCSNSVFREIVQLQLRDSKRTEQPAQVVVMRYIRPYTEDSGPRQSRDLQRQARDMKRLEGVLSSTLRAGDPFTKMSSSQFAILLPTASTENARCIIERVVNNFKREYPHSNLRFQAQAYNLEVFRSAVKAQEPS